MIRLAGGKVEIILGSRIRSGNSLGLIDGVRGGEGGGRNGEENERKRRGHDSSF